MILAHTCGSLIYNKYFHLVKNTMFHLQAAVDIHNIEDKLRAIVFPQPIDKNDPDSIQKQTKAKEKN